jgi:predicted dehydrogenase
MAFAETTGDDTAVIHGHLAGGGVVVAAGSWAVRNGAGTRIAAYGSDGTITMDSSGKIFAARGTDQLAPVPLPAEVAQAVGGQRDVPALFAALARDFMDTLHGSEPPPGGRPFATFDDGLAVQRIIAAGS